jgi:YfiH family protein
MTFCNSSSAQIDFTAEVPYLSFPVLSEIPFIKHGFSTRLGGVSKDMFESMNLGSESSVYQDDPKNILANYERISAGIGIDPHSIVVSKQVHKTNIHLVTEEDKGKGLYLPRDYDEIDGFITNKPGITLVTKYADCVPLFLVDTRNKAIGLTHSGWRGTVSKIGKKTVMEMKKQFGSEPEDITAVIGPSICSDCYEVGEEVAQAFLDAFSENGYNMDIILRRNDNGRYQLNLWEVNRGIFKEAGLQDDHIHVSGVCTSCHSDWLFSHRKTNGKRGSLAAFLALKGDLVY